jgi:FKBP-type peptidyl-prolyl cis-trans isomerase
MLLKKYFVAIVIVLVGCSGKDEYPGFSLSEEGIYYKLKRIGEQTKKAGPGDFITLDILYKTTEDSVFFEGRRKIQVSSDSLQDIDKCFMMLSEGDQAEFILNARDFFHNTLNASLPSFLDTNDVMVVDLNMIEIQSQEEYQKEKTAFLKWVEDFGEYESVILKQYLEENKINSEPTSSGLYKFVIEEGNERQVSEGDTVIVHYEGKFLNGKYFDSTVKRKEPFGFVYGTEWQVIDGLEEAIGMMKEGERSLFIIPSELAFGKKGSSTGIIPPYTSVIFEVHLLEIN